MPALWPAPGTVPIIGPYDFGMQGLSIFAERRVMITKALP